MSDLKTDWKLALKNKLFWVTFIFILSIILVLTWDSVQAADYGPAIDKAKQAGMIQTGLQAKYDLVTKTYPEKTAIYLGNKLGITKPASFLVGAYGVYQKREITFSLGEIGCNLKQDRVELKIPL